MTWGVAPGCFEDAPLALTETRAACRDGKRGNSKSRVSGDLDLVFPHVSNPRHKLRRIQHHISLETFETPPETSALGDVDPAGQCRRRESPNRSGRPRSSRSHVAMKNLRGRLIEFSAIWTTRF